jgi:hypothetical protein
MSLLLKLPSRLLKNSREIPTRRHTREGGYPVSDATVVVFNNSLDSRLRGNDKFFANSEAKIVFQQPARAVSGYPA